MSKNEEVKNPQPEVDEVEVEVNDQEESVESAPDVDDLEAYSKKVSKRVNKLNEQKRLERQRAEEYKIALQQENLRAQQYQERALKAEQDLLNAEEEKIEVKKREADELYKKAHATNDADLINRADSLKNDVAIAKEKLRIAKQKQNNQVETQVNPQQVYQQSYPQTPQPTQRALAWAQANPWYGQNKDATDFASETHDDLVMEGYVPDSDAYYEQINTRVLNEFPDLKSGEAEQKEDRPPVQRVASASVGSRQQTQGKKNGVSFTKSEVERLRGLKPHGMEEDVWLKSVAKQKQKIASREAK
jgi:hypothetical protein